MKKDIYKLNLHEYVILDKDTSVSRVPGGWIYEFTHSDLEGNLSSTCTFVPFNNEFQT